MRVVGKVTSVTTRNAAPPDKASRISPAAFDAVLVDLDGVVTETARLHAAAWKAAFDALLAEQADAAGRRDHEPFDSNRDYRRHVDGKPREAGVRGFLAARGVSLPEGAPDDSPGRHTVHGVANAKNAAYHRLLNERGVQVHADALDFLKRARAAGLTRVVVTSSRNAAAVLSAAGLDRCFELRVDGNDLAAEGLAGKPAPDLFLLAARRAQADPARAVVLEDALSGMAAGRAGGFGRVVGVARGNSPEDLRAHGADVAVTDLRALDVGDDAGPAGEPLLSPRGVATSVLAEAGNRRLAVFLDYDGTLTPIVPRPELAVISEEMRATLKRLVRLCTVAIISGRDRPDVAEKVGVRDLVYAGSHGFDIAGPEGTRIARAEGEADRDELRAAARELREALASVDGAIVEEKAFGVAVHYRQVPESEAPRVEQAVDAAQERHPGLKRTAGKKVHEFRPGVDWDKGKALLWLLDALELSADDTLPLYLGDDVTDEDAFKALAGRGIGIRIGDDGGRTHARYCLPDVAAVQCFLEELADRLEDGDGT